MAERKRGFTLVELLIAMLIGLVVLGAVYSVFTVQNKQFSNQEVLTEMQQNARIAMDILVREIGMAGYNQTSTSCSSPVARCSGTATAATNTPCTGITNAGAAAISFTADLNSNCDTTAGSSNPNENITYSVDSTTNPAIPTLYRESNGSSQPAVEHVSSLSFTYYDSAGNPPTNVADIRRIKVSLTTRASKEDPDYRHPTAGDHYRRYTLESFAIPRNLALSSSATTTTTTTGGATTTTTTTTTTGGTTTTTAAATTTTASATTTTAASTTTTTATTTTTTGGSPISNVTQNPSGSTIAKNIDVEVCADIAGTYPTKMLKTNQGDNLAMTLSSGNTYCATIPKHNNQTVNYWIELTDSGGYVTTGSTYTYNQEN